MENIVPHYPNPFNPSTTIQYGLPLAGYIFLKVHDVLGQEIALRADGFSNAGSYKVRSNAGRVASGVYFYKLRSEGYTQVWRMLLVK